jgi:hypothetical protein
MIDYTVSQTWIGLVLIGAVYVFLIRRQSAEKCRSEIRTLRDELFDFMLRNKHDFSHPAYIEARQAMNGLLRLTNSLNSIGCLYLMVTSQPKKAAFESLPKAELREAIQHSLSRSVRAYYRYTFFTGVTGILMNTVYYVLRLAHLLDRMRNRLSRFREALFAYGYEIGTPSLSNSQLSVIGHRSTDRCWR